MRQFPFFFPFIMARGVNVADDTNERRSKIEANHQFENNENTNEQCYFFTHRVTTYMSDQRFVANKTYDIGEQFYVLFYRIHK